MGSAIYRALEQTPRVNGTRRGVGSRGRAAPTWRDRPERGSRAAKRLIIWLALHLRHSLCRALLLPICAYFLVTAPVARRASRAFLGRALGRRATLRDIFKHLFVFATTLLDRVYLVHGRRQDFVVTVQNDQLFYDALACGRGCLLLGSHLGSFEMLAVMGSVEKHLPINMVMHLTDHVGLRNLIRDSKLDMPYKVIALGRPDSMLRVKECLDRGEVVGILADRVYGSEPTQHIPFLGIPARFSLSPFRLARITGAPVLMVSGLFRSGRRYEIVFAPLTLSDDRASRSSCST